MAQYSNIYIQFQHLWEWIYKSDPQLFLQVMNIFTAYIGCYSLIHSEILYTYITLIQIAISIDEAQTYGDVI